MHSFFHDILQLVVVRVWVLAGAFRTLIHIFVPIDVLKIVLSYRGLFNFYYQKNPSSVVLVSVRTSLNFLKSFFKIH